MFFHSGAKAAHSVDSSVIVEMYSGIKPFSTVSESKTPFSEQSFGDYVGFYNLERAHESTMHYHSLHHG